MRKKLTRAFLSMMMLIVILFCTMAPVSALDDKYTFDELGMSVKVSKNYNVITRDSDRSDEVFTTLNLDYDETMTAFKAANIYLRAYDPDGIFQISLTVTSDEQSKAVNNYSDLTSADRSDILDVLLSDASVTSAVEIKHSGNIFFDSTRELEVDGRPLYISQSNTIINGMQIDLSLQKYDEAILPEETRILTNMASSLDFDRINRNTGPTFEWWRLLLWFVLLIGISVAISYIYKQYNEANRRKLEERRQRRAAHSDTGAGEADSPITFDEALGYHNDSEFSERADTDLDNLDINVQERDPMSGVSYFEDEGDGIDDGTDYFDTYFKEPTEHRPPASLMLSTVGAYIKIALKHLGYFFINLIRTITGRGKKTDKTEDNITNS